MEGEAAEGWSRWLEALADEADSLQGARSLAVHGRIAVAVGDLERATRLFEAAYRLDPSEASVLSEAAAVELQRGKAGEAAAFHLPRALEMALTASDEGDDSVEGRFNRALVLEALGLDTAANTAWREYLRSDPDSEWAVEARTRIVANERRPSAEEEWRRARERLERWLDASASGTARSAVGDAVERFPELCRRYAEEELLQRWARETEPQGEERIRQLMAAIGDGLARRNDDLYLHDLSVELTSAARSGPRLRRLREAVASYGRGFAAVDVQETETARQEFAGARVALEQLGSPLVGWVDLETSIALWYEGEYEAALATLDPLADWALARRYRSLHARSLQITGIVRYQLRDLTGALDSCVAAAASFDRLGESEQSVHLHSTIALAYFNLGDSEKAWLHLLRGILGRDRIVQPRRRYSLMVRGGGLALDAGYPRSALLFFEQAHRAALDWGSPAAEAESLWWSARGNLRLGRNQEALALLRRAEPLIPKIESGPLAQRILGDLRMVDGEGLLDADPAAALARLDEAMEAYLGSDYRDYQPQVLRQRARARWALGRPAEAQADLLSAIEIFEDDRGRVAEPETRVALFDLATGLFEDAIRFHLLAGEPELAFDLVERSRSRVLLDALAASAGGVGRVGEPLTGDEIVAALADGVTLVEFAVLEDRTAAWVTAAGLRRHHEIPVGAVELAELVDRARAALEADRWDATPLRDLYARLWRPLTGDLPPGAEVTIVADRSLHRLPFALLQDEAGRHLFEHHALVVAPSGSVFVHASRLAATRRPAARGHLVGFGAPDISASKLSWLPALPAAKEETRRVATLYPSSDVRVGGAASKAEFLALAHRADVLHVATHAVARPDDAGRSTLLLAAGAEATGDLTLEELRRVRLDGPRLVVLSACETARGRVWRSEGSVALSHGFLAAGVPTVVASLLQVESGATGELLIPFHRHLRDGLTPARALQAAQLELLAGAWPGSRPKKWAAFQVYGAGHTALFEEELRPSR